jgi:hypothetical protein
MKRNFFYFLFSIFLITITWLLFGIYWGWIDDIYLANAINGTFFKDPPQSLFINYYVLLSKGFIFLNQIIPRINWYGVFNLACLFLIVYLFIALIYHTLNKSKQSNFFNILFIFLLFMVALAEAIYLQTFTSNALILFGLSAIYFLNEPKLKNLSVLVLLIIALLIRSDVIILLFPIIAVFILINNKEKIKLILLLAFITIALPIILKKIQTNDDAKEWEKYSSTIINILDAGNAETYENMLKKDKARSYAFYTWFQGDFNNLLNQEYIDKLEIHSPFSITTFKKATIKIEKEIDKSCCKYDENYTSSRNWSMKGIVATSIIILLSILFVCLEKDKKRKFLIALFPLAFITTILFTTILFKMEYRVFYPVALITVLALLLSNKHLASKYLVYVLLILLLIAFPSRLKEYYVTSLDLKEEINKKESFRTELNAKFSNKIILFDFLTTSLYSPTFFKTHAFNEGNNTFLLYGEVFSNFLESHKAYLSEICGSYEIVPFFKCLYEKREEVVFALTDHRVYMYEMYFKDVYGIPIKFKKLELKPNHLNAIHYSYSYNKLNMDYYVFDDSFFEGSCN